MVLILHGYGAHCMRYNHVGISFAEEGILTFGHDYQGMGQSEGERVPATEFTVYTADILQHIDIVRSKYGSLPLFLVGQSIGSLLILMSVLERPDLCQGAVHLGAPIKPSVGWATRIAISCANALTPSYVPLKSDSTTLTRDQEEVRTYLQDPLVWKNALSIGFINSFFYHLDLIRPRLGEISVPTLLYHGGADATMSPENSHIIHQEIGSRDKEVRVIPHCMHSLLHELEPERSAVIHGIRQWMLDRSGRKL